MCQKPMKIYSIRDAFAERLREAEGQERRGLEEALDAMMRMMRTFRGWATPTGPVNGHG